MVLFGGTLDVTGRIIMRTDESVHKLALRDVEQSPKPQIETLNPRPYQVGEPSHGLSAVPNS